MPDIEHKSDSESLPGGGFLTEKDRKYLRGDLELEGSTERRRRLEIRNRLQKALIDFQYLKGLSDRDRLLVFGEAAGWWLNQDESVMTDIEPTGKGARMVEGMISMMTLIAYSLPESGVRRVVETGLEQVPLQDLALMEGEYAPVDVSIEIEVKEDESVPLEELKERFEEGEQIPLQAFYSLDLVEEFGIDEWHQYLRETGKEVIDE